MKVTLISVTSDISLSIIQKRSSRGWTNNVTDYAFFRFWCSSPIFIPDRRIITIPWRPLTASSRMLAGHADKSINMRSLLFVLLLLISRVPYLALAKTFEAMESTKKRYIYIAIFMYDIIYYQAGNHANFEQLLAVRDMSIAKWFGALHVSLPEQGHPRLRGRWIWAGRFCPHKCAESMHRSVVLDSYGLIDRLIRVAGVLRRVTHVVVQLHASRGHN